MTHRTTGAAAQTVEQPPTSCVPAQPTGRPFPRTLTPTWVVLYLVLYWIQVYLLQSTAIPHRPLIFDGLFLLATAVVLGYYGGFKEVGAYLVGRLVPARKVWPTAVLLVVLMGLVFYAIGWGQAGAVERPNLEGWVLAPVTEEMVFRGVILTALLSHSTAPQWAIVLLSALLFASCHGVEDGWRLLRLTASGCIYGYAYVLTGSITFCAVSHALWNAMACCAVMQHGT